MPAERYFTKQNLVPHETVEINDKEFLHLAKVMRASKGDRVELVNGNGALANAQVKCIEKHKALLEIVEVSFEQPPSFQVIIAQAIPRINRLDFIVEKGTELGMTELWLFPGRHSERQTLSEQQLTHCHSVLVAAIKQSGRLYIPQIRMMTPLKAWKQLDYPAFYGDVNLEAPSFASLWQKESPKDGVIFFVGPESGFHHDEEASLKNLGAKGVSLHKNILRTDTASLVALSLISGLQ